MVGTLKSTILQTLVTPMYHLTVRRCELVYNRNHKSGIVKGLEKSVPYRQLGINTEITSFM